MISSKRAKMPCHVGNAGGEVPVSVYFGIDSTLRGLNQTTVLSWCFSRTWPPAENPKK